mgnify:CR=1 FL=1
MKKLFYLLTIVVAFISCTPSSFIQTSNVSWSSVPLRDDIEFDEAWNQVIDVLARQFEMEMISKDGAYARTGWIYTWNKKGDYKDNYRNRVIIKFSPDRTKVEIKTEAQYGSPKNWKNGFDSGLLKTIKQDIMGVVGRTTR